MPHALATVGRSIKVALPSDNAFYVHVIKKLISDILGSVVVIIFACHAARKRPGFDSQPGRFFWLFSAYYFPLSSHIFTCSTPYSRYKYFNTISFKFLYIIQSYSYGYFVNPHKFVLPG